MKKEYQFTVDWFDRHIPLWKPLLEKTKPLRILEVGSFEGRSAKFLIETCSEWGSVELHCVDSWCGGEEHVGIDFSSVEEKFDYNVTLALNGIKHESLVYKHKSLSSVALAGLLADKKGNFDLIYIDGSHVASDVFLDAALSFALLRTNGILIFDDYLRKDQDELQHPQIAIDAFVSVHRNKLKPIKFSIGESEEQFVDIESKGVLYQKFLMKIAE